jgi:CDP-paratose 2-epimerase
VIGTLNTLEFARKTNTPLLYTSTIKVYSAYTLNKLAVLKESGYFFSRKKAISETSPTIDFIKEHHPLGVSKLIAEKLIDQYNLSYKLPTVILRLSTVFGPYQHGSEELGWVTWFIKAKKKSKKITIYGNGKQVRDCLWIEDLSELLLKLVLSLEKYSGTIYNVGGGPQNSISLLRLVNYLDKKGGKKLNLNFENSRPDDYKVFISDLSKVKKETKWEPRVNVFEGIDSLWRNRNL